MSLYFNGRALVCCDEKGEDMPLPNRNIEAPGFGLVVGKTTCWSCAANIRAAALWVPSHAYWPEPDWEPNHEPDPALLGYVEAASRSVLAQVTHHAPWMTFVSTKTAGISYLANCCSSCRAVQGDHFLRRPGDVFFPETPVQVQALRLILGEGRLEALASPAMSSWMSAVPPGNK